MKVFKNVLKFLLLFIFLFILNTCTIVEVKNKETTGKVLYKNLLKKSEKIKQAYIAGFLKISGIKDIPSVHLKFESQCDFEKKRSSFSISALKKPIIDLVFNEKEVIFINHTNKEFVRLNIEKIDFSKIIGINFNPLEIGYFFLGDIPYSKNMELLSFDLTPKEYFMDISNDTSKYSIILNRKEEIIEAIIKSQYFDDISLESIKYKKTIRGNLPGMLTFYNEDRSIKISFIINKTSLEPFKKSIADLKILKSYTELQSLDNIKIEVKKE